MRSGRCGCSHYNIPLPLPSPQRACTARYCSLQVLAFLLVPVRTTADNCVALNKQLDQSGHNLNGHGRGKAKRTDVMCAVCGYHASVHSRKLVADLVSTSF